MRKSVIRIGLVTAAAASGLVTAYLDPALGQGGLGGGYGILDRGDVKHRLDITSVAYENGKRSGVHVQVDVKDLRRKDRVVIKYNLDRDRRAELGAYVSNDSFPVGFIAYQNYGTGCNDRGSGRFNVDADLVRVHVPACWVKAGVAIRVHVLGRNKAGNRISDWVPSRHGRGWTMRIPKT